MRFLKISLLILVVLNIIDIYLFFAYGFSFGYAPGYRDFYGIIIGVLPVLLGLLGLVLLLLFAGLLIKIFKHK